MVTGICSSMHNDHRILLYSQRLVVSWSMPCRIELTCRLANSAVLLPTQRPMPSVMSAQCVDVNCQRPMCPRQLPCACLWRKSRNRRVMMNACQPNTENLVNLCVLFVALFLYSFIVCTFLSLFFHCSFACESVYESVTSWFLSYCFLACVVHENLFLCVPLWCFVLFFFCVACIFFACFVSVCLFVPGGSNLGLGCMGTDHLLVLAGARS